MSFTGKCMYSAMKTAIERNHKLRARTGDGRSAPRGSGRQRSSPGWLAGCRAVFVVGAVTATLSLPPSFSIALRQITHV